MKHMNVIVRRLIMVVVIASAIVIGSSTVASAAPAIPEMGGMNLGGVVINRITGADGEDSITNLVFKKAMEGFASWALDDTAKFVNYTLWKITTASTPVVNGNAQNGDWFAIQYQMMMNVGWWLMLPLLFVTIIHSVLKGSMQLLLRSVGMYLPLAIIGTIVDTVHPVDDHDRRRHVCGVREAHRGRPHELHARPV
jgi:hypothetical protein